MSSPLRVITDKRRHYNVERGDRLVFERKHGWRFWRNRTETFIVTRVVRAHHDASNDSYICINATGTTSTRTIYEFERRRDGGIVVCADGTPKMPCIGVTNRYLKRKAKQLPRGYVGGTSTQEEAPTR